MKSYPRKKGREHTRMKVRERDGFRCAMCGKRRTPAMAKRWGLRLFDVHHLGGMCGKNSRGYDRVDKIHTMITLCHCCHFHHPDHSQFRKWNKARKSFPHSIGDSLLRKKDSVIRYRSKANA